MKAIKLLFIALLAANVYSVRSQDIQITKKDSIVTSSWIFGLGLNAVDDAGSEFIDVFNFEENWNVVPFPSRLSIGKYFKNGLGLEAIGTFNQYMEGKNVDGAIITEDIDYYAVDFRASYDLNKILGQTGWFDPYVGVGAGYTDANNQGRGTYNASVGFRTWFSDRVGLDFNSTGKWAMNIENATNHIQHGVSVVYQFGMEKGLSDRGMAKLAALEEIEQEQQRVNDSVVAARQAENRAKELAERLKIEEAEKLALKENNERAAKQIQRDEIEKQLASLGDLYFDLNSSILKPQHNNILNQLVILLLTDYPQAVIEVTSHTDARGDANYNMWLSEKRLKKTVDYLRSKGVASERIKAKAQGEEHLVNECKDKIICSEEKHSLNRRSEFKLLEILE